MAGSWQSSVGGSQQVKSWTALWMDHGRVQWEVHNKGKSWTALWMDHGGVQ